MSETVHLSVVIPSHNRRERLRALLETLALQTEPAASFEVVVVLDGSTDGTEKMLEQLETPFRMTVIAQEQRGVVVARNQGVAAAKGRFCLLLDDDILPAANAVANHLRVQRERGGVVGFGRVERRLPKRPARWARIDALERRLHYDSMAAGRPPTFLDCYSQNVCLPRDMYLAVGGFAEDIQIASLRFGFRYNDLEFAYRLREHGATFVYVAGAEAEEDDGETLHDLISDALLRGESGLAICERHPDLLQYLTHGGWHPVEGVWGRLLRFLLAIRIPPLVVGTAGSFVPRTYWARSWYRLLFQYSYWSGVRRTLHDRDEWARLRRAATSVGTGH